MNDLIHRYLDGELSDDEARALHDAITSDPALEAELRGWERMLRGAAAAEPAALSADFTDRVMGRVLGRRGSVRRALRALFAVAVPARLAWAATLVLTFALGVIATRGRHVPAEPASPPAGTEAVAAAVDEGEMRVVRLVYASPDPKVRVVRVAGTFNDWNAEGVAMERRGDLWTAVLVLPRGTYEYMFVEDDAHWVTDPLALQTRDDGFGRKNAVLDLAL
jgi:anti-sigma-K factor RskA